MLEVCVDNFQSAKNAIEGGADRLELCADLFQGGLTPELALLKEIRSFSDIPIHVMIRSRAGDFCYSNQEMTDMLTQIDYFNTQPIEGYVFGSLSKDGQINTIQLKAIQDQIGGKNLVFHRAIDESRDILKSIQTLVNCGVKEVLTSGGKDKVVEAIEMMNRLQSDFGNRIALLAGSGLNVDNVESFLKSTELTRIHGSFSETLRDGNNEKIKLTSAQDVDKAKHILESFNP